MSETENGGGFVLVTNPGVFKRDWLDSMYPGCLTELLAGKASFNHRALEGFLRAVLLGWMRRPKAFSR